MTMYQISMYNFEYPKKDEQRGFIKIFSFDTYEWKRRNIKWTNRFKHRWWHKQDTSIRLYNDIGFHSTFKIIIRTERLDTMIFLLFNKQLYLL